MVEQELLGIARLLHASVSGNPRATYIDGSTGRKQVSVEFRQVTPVVHTVEIGIGEAEDHVNLVNPTISASPDGTVEMTDVKGDGCSIGPGNVSIRHSRIIPA